MFAKKPKLEIPPGTFIPTPARVMAIIQLCLAFSLIAWIASQPFMGDLFAIKSKMLLYENVMGSRTLSNTATGKDAEILKAKLKRNSERFSQLPEEQREKILTNYIALEDQTRVSFWDKLEKMFLLLFFDTPPLVQAWLLFSIVIPVLVLLRIDGAVPAVWILPLITLAYGIDNRLNGKSPGEDVESRLFPSEETIVKEYLKEPLSSSILEQKNQLTKGWHVYLVKEWAHEAPSNNPDEFNLQVENGEFAFNIGRLNAVIDKEGEETGKAQAPRKESWGTLALYLIWNILFAVIITKKA